MMLIWCNSYQTTLAVVCKIPIIPFFDVSRLLEFTNDKFL